MNLQRLLEQKTALDRKIQEAKTVGKNLDRVKKLVAGLVEDNPKLALVDRAVVKEKLTTAIQEAIAGL